MRASPFGTQFPFTPANILREAKALIEREGWAQPGQNNTTLGFHRGPVGFCAHHAIMEIGGQTATCGLAVIAFSKAVIPDGRGTSIEIVEWNDRRGRTKEQVLHAFGVTVRRLERRRPDE
jgi:hypothetical protein